MTSLPPAAPEIARAQQVDYVSEQLLPRAALATRLLARQLRGELSRTEASLLNTLSAGPRRITELAELEGVAQPTMTLLVKGLEERRLVRRTGQAHDGRVVLVSIASRGTAALEAFRAQAGAALREYLADMSDEQIAALGTATEALQTLITVLQGR